MSTGHTRRRSREYGSYQEAVEKAEAWQGGTQTGKRMYVLINNLGCAQ